MIRENAIIEEAENTSNYEPGLFGHAEFNLVHKLVNKYPDKLYLAKKRQPCGCRRVLALDGDVGSTFLLTVSAL